MGVLPCGPSGGIMFDRPLFPSLRIPRLYCTCTVSVQYPSRKREDRTGKTTASGKVPSPSDLTLARGRRLKRRSYDEREGPPPGAMNGHGQSIFVLLKTEIAGSPVLRESSSWER